MTASLSEVSIAQLLVPVTGSCLAESVGQQIADAIQLGLFAKGEQLPSENVLAGQLGVSTLTLREALATLRNQGLVETRRGRNGGSFVCGPSPAPAARLRARLRELSSVELRDLGDEWTAVAGTTARLAATRAADHQIERLRSLAGELSLSKSISARTRANSRFAIELALAAQSERLTRAEVRLQGESGELLWTPASSPLQPQEVAADLHRIADAVADEDAELSRTRAEARTRKNMRFLIAAHLELTER
jgi:DNA-binding FadR family transcriptional regulator